MPQIRHERGRRAIKSPSFAEKQIEISLKRRREKQENQAVIDEIGSKLRNLRLPKASQVLIERNINTTSTDSNNDVLLDYEFYFGEQENAEIPAPKQYSPQKSVPMRNIPMEQEPWYVVEKSTDGWWKGETMAGNIGWFPSNYVEEEATTNGNQGSIENRSPVAVVLPPPIQQQAPAAARTSLEVVVALYSFDASSSEELSFKKGERLEIIDHPAHDPDWWMARNTYGNTGIVPRNYIDVVGDTSSNKSSQQEFVPQYSGSSEIPMEQEPWYFGRISRERAEDLLQVGREGQFLVRDSESNPGDFTISVRGTACNKHFEVLNICGQLKIGDQTFLNMNTLFTYYQMNAILPSPTEKLYLTEPLPKETHFFPFEYCCPI